MATETPRSSQEWKALCNVAKESIPSVLGENAWEVIVAAALITSPEPQLLGQFYSYLTQNDDCYTTAEQQKRLSLRLRDTILKLLTLVGAPQVISALMPLAKAEGSPEEKAKSSRLSRKWEHVDVPAIHARGAHTIDTIYGQLLPKLFAGFGDHFADVQFNELFAVYGLYLSDFEVMTELETEAVVFTTISCCGLRGPSLWHMRGMGRVLGARGIDEDSEKMHNIKDVLRGLKSAMMSIVEWVGEDYVRRARLESWVNVGDVVRELNGWGDDEVS